MAGQGGQRAHDGWRSPAGVAALAAVAGALIAAAALFVGRGVAGDDDRTVRTEEAGVLGGQQATPSDPSDEDAYLFVYGTTMPGHLRYPDIEELVADAQPDTATGRIYDSGAGYPAAVFGGDVATIEGYVLQLRPERADEALRTFTEMEAGLFHPVEIVTDSGVTATAYEWIGSTDGMAELDGRWDGPEA